MSHSYSARLLWVDLSRGTVATREVDPQTLVLFMGGSGLAAKVIWDETTAQTEPLSEENALVIMTGPLTGTVVSGNSRCVIAALSPLTNIWGESYLGGTWANMFRRTPYLGIVVKGQARRPVSLWVDGERAWLESAEHLWGQDSYETHHRITSEAPGFAVLTIGPAGENLVRMASVMADGVAGRAAARCGLGAVMGSKRLKAVVVRGKEKPWVADSPGLKESFNRHFPRVVFNPQQWQEKNREVWTPHVSKRGCVKNFTQSDLPGFGQMLYETAMEARPWYCTGCRTGCMVSMMMQEHRHPPGQHMQPFGSNCLIQDREALLTAFDWCNRYGLDAISTGQTIAFAMELYERGLLSKRDAGGIELTWGNHDAMLQVLHLIAQRRGIGELLAQGSREAARRVGGPATECAIHVKGLEFPQYDPRVNNSVALQYATSSRGAHHMEGFIGLHSQGFTSRYPPYALPYQKDEDARKACLDPLATAGKGKLTAWAQDLCSVIDSSGVCKFLATPFVWVREPEEPATGMLPEHLAELVNYATGGDLDVEVMFRTGERIFNLKRLINVRRGVSRKDDILPTRLLTQKRGGEGPAAENLPPLEDMLREYYSCRGWSEAGIPTPEKLKELRLPVYLPASPNATL